MHTLALRPLEDQDREWVRSFLTKEWASPKIVTRGRIHQADQLPGFVALDRDKPVGLLTYHIDNDQCEMVMLNSLKENIGVGTALINAVKDVTLKQKCRRLWLITTNDNCHALRFYQKSGFTLAALHKNAIAESRRLKPEISGTGTDGIPIRDEIELEMLF